MSEPHYSTGRYEDRPCARCGQEVKHQEIAGMYGSPPRWMAARHEAPCGWPCWGAGVPPRAWRSKEVHWGPGECHRCTHRDQQDPGDEHHDPPPATLREAAARGPVKGEQLRRLMAAASRDEVSEFLGIPWGEDLPTKGVG